MVNVRSVMLRLWKMNRKQEDQRENYTKRKKARGSRKRRKVSSAKQGEPEMDL